MLEIFSIFLVIPVVVILRRLVGFNYAHGHRSSKKNDDDAVNTKDSNAYMASMAVDFFFIVIPLLLIFTVLTEWTQVLAVLLTLILLLCIIVKRDNSSSMQRFRAPDFTRKVISAFRAITMIVTCLCILAVDFQIFPRKYAKTETYGTGWMDLGVGSFVLMNALVSRQARNVHSGGWKTALQSTCPLILLGFGRLVSTRGIDYQVHAGEYGVHWNFFFTLAGVSLLTSTISIHPQYCGILGLFILIGYQIFLVQGLNAYLLSDVRGMDIISQNKEGIFSIFGYWGLYLVGVQISYHIFFQNNHPASSDKRTRRLFVVSLLLWLLTIVLDHHVERVSRRMCNMAYVMLVLAGNFQILAIAMLSEYIIPGIDLAVLEGAFNQNLLSIFLLANILTGLVNLSIDTISASSIQALFILVMYSFSLCFFAGVTYFYGFRLKFW